jgi:hypothetical protein
LSKTKYYYVVKIALSHKTTTFDRSVKLLTLFRLCPAAHSRTAIEGYTFKKYLQKHINWQQDPFETKPASFS